MKKLTFIDLFCGCGGFRLGMERAGFDCLSAVDFNPEAIAVFGKNFAHVPQVLDKDLTGFRYTRQHWMKPCSTIAAHLSKDGLTQNRSLTPRRTSRAGQAARIQSFPGWFEFPIARTHQFRVIGNAVPPLVSEAVGNPALN